MLLFFSIEQLRTDNAIKKELVKLLNPSFPVSMNENLIIDTLLRYLSTYRDDLHVVAEDRYVDKVYRNSFSNYYSTKLNVYPEYCVRLSFLESGVDFNNKEDILSKYLGFMVIRPIYPGTVGRTAVNPRALKSGDQIRICKTRIRSSILGYKTYVEAFPHSSQDSEYSTCAETSIWSIMEYFGNKYPEYTPILPSKIHEILDRKANERHIPSLGLAYFDISYVLKSCGFGTKIYGRNRHFSDKKLDDAYSSEFRRTFSIYIESGIPVAVGISSKPGTKPFGHAVVGIGRKNIDRALITTAPLANVNGKEFRRWSDVPTEFVFNDDNVGIYQQTNFDNPAPQHHRSDIYISYIMVPLYNKIYLDAPGAIRFSEEFCTKQIALKNDSVFRTYLSSGNSFMNHIMSDSLIPDIYKNAFIRFIRFPKFVWITEIAEVDEFCEHKSQGLLVLDATEPYKSRIVYPLLCVYDNELFLNDFETNQYRVVNVKEQFKCTSFNNI